jgi:hypothetical protein
MLHFVGFRGDEFTRAKAVFGPPQFIHRHFDPRMAAEVVEGDMIVFANGAENRPTEYSFNDSECF